MAAATTGWKLGVIIVLTMIVSKEIEQRFVLDFHIIMFFAYNILPFVHFHSLINSV